MIYLKHFSQKKEYEYGYGNEYIDYMGVFRFRYKKTEELVVEGFKKHCDDPEYKLIKLKVKYE